MLVSFIGYVGKLRSSIKMYKLSKKNKLILAANEKGQSETLQNRKEIEK